MPDGPEGVNQFWRADVVECGVEGDEQARDAGPGPAADGQAAPTGADGLHDGSSGGPASDDIGAQGEGDTADALPLAGGVSPVGIPDDEASEVVACQRLGCEGGSGGGSRADAVDPVGVPAAVGVVAGDEVPAPGPDDEVVRLDLQGRLECGLAGRGDAAVGRGVVESQDAAGADGRPEGLQGCRVEGRSGELSVVAQARDLEGLAGGPQAGGHDLAQGGQRAGDGTSGAGVALAARAGRALVVTGSLTLAVSQGLLGWLVRDGATAPGCWPLAGAMFLGGLGPGLGAPILVNVVLAGVPGRRQAGAAGGVLSTVNQIGGAAGVAVLGTVFFNALAPAAGTASGAPEQLFGHALAQVMPWQVATCVLAALAMLALPRTAASHQR